MPLHVTSGKQGVLWNGSFFVDHSLALVNRELVLALLNSNRFDIGIQNFEAPTFDPASVSRFAPLNARLNAHPVSPSVTVRHRWPADFTRPASGKLVMIQPWEFGSLPKAWVQGIESSVDEVWVPSHFVREEYLLSGVPGDKVVVVPNGVNTERFHPGVTPANLPTKKSYKFLFVGGTIARKGIDVLLDGYLSAFTAGDDVTLIIKDFGSKSFYAGQDASALIAAVQAKPGAPEIIHLTEDLSEDGMASLYAACDALVHPYRGEGYGLPIAEAMACGKPTVVTGFGAALDFANKNNSFLIPATKTYFNQTHIGDLELVDKPWWAEPNREALAAILKSLYENPESGVEIGKVAAQDIAANHTWAHAAEIAAKRLVELGSKAGAYSTSVASSTESNYEVRKQEALQFGRTTNWMQALEEIAALGEAADSDWDLQNLKGVALYRTGKREESLAILKYGAENAPNSRDFHHNIAFLLLSGGDVCDAMNHALLAAEASPDNSDVRRTLERARQAVVQEARRIRKKQSNGSTKAAKRDGAFQELAALIARAEAILNETSGVAPMESAEKVSLASPVLPKLSVVMIVKNEEKFLRECLQSVKSVAHQIVVVDTGSTDSTVEIAQEFGATIVNHTWTDDFAAARNVSLDHATGDWALWLDADERLAEGDGDLLRYLMIEAEKNVGGYMVNIRNIMTSAENPEVCWHRACRLFRIHPKIRFTGRIHEQNMRALQEQGYVCALSQLKIDHYGYMAEVMDERNKHERFIRMLTREVEENPDDDYKTFHIFNLGNAYFTQGDMTSAAHWFAQAGPSADPGEEYTGILFVEWATALYATQRSAEAMKVCELADRKGIKHPSLEFARGHACLHLQRYAEAEMRFRLAIETGGKKQFVETGDTGAYTYKAEYGVALALTGQDRYEEAIVHCRRALEGSPTFRDARYLLAKMLLRCKNPKEACSELELLLAQYPDFSAANEDLGQALYELGDYTSAISPLRRATEINPESTDIWLRLGDCCLNIGFFDEAKDAFLAARRLSPRSAEVCVNLGRSYIGLGSHGEAIDAFTDAMFIDPQYSNAYFNVGDLLYQMGYYPKAAEALQAGLQLDPKNASGFLVLGNCYFQTQDFAAAKLAYEAAVQRKPDYTEARNNLEMAVEILAEKAEAA